MARPKKDAAAEVVEVKEAVFDPASLTIEQQEAVVEQYFGVNPRYFIYEGLAVRLNHSRFEADERNRQKAADLAGEKYDRKAFNGWKPKLEGRETRR